MTKQGYPESLNCWLRDYPRYIKVTFGSEMGNLDGPWDNGSVILLERIGFDPPDTSPVVDEVPPDIKVTYSDNGTDVGWIFKMGMYGWGTFFATIAGANYYVGLEKSLEFESTYFNLKRFRYKEVVETEISKTIEIPSVTVPVEVIYNPPPGEPPPGYVPPPGRVPPPVTIYWDSLARTLVAYYSTLLNLDPTYTVSATVASFSNLNKIGRQIGPITSAGGSTVEYWIGDGKILIYLINITIDCESWTQDEGFTDCTYSSYVSSAYYFTSIIVNGTNRLLELLRRV